MATILQFLLKKISIYQTLVFPVWPVMWKTSRNSDLSKHKYWVSIFGKWNTRKAQTDNKDAASKKIVESILEPVSTLRAEVSWTLKVASSHFSLRSCLGLNKLFRCMFTDAKLSSLSNWARQNVVTLWILNLPLISKTCWNQIKASACISWEYEQIIERVANGCAD